MDGAQAPGHIPIRLADLQCDFFLAGCHKWLRTYQPLGLGFLGRPESREYIQDTLDELRHARAVDDPLLDFSEDIRSERKSAFGETVNLSPLFTCPGGLQDAEDEHLATSRLGWQHEEAIDEATDESPWQLAVTDNSLRSNIFMLEPQERPSLTADELRHQFHQAGVALTVYSNGSIRLSLPLAPLTLNQREQLEVRSVAGALVGQVCQRC